MLNAQDKQSSLVFYSRLEYLGSLLGVHFYKVIFFYSILKTQNSNCFLLPLSFPLSQKSSAGIQCPGSSRPRNRKHSRSKEGHERYSEEKCKACWLSPGFRRTAAPAPRDAEICGMSLPMISVTTSEKERRINMFSCLP